MKEINYKKASIFYLFGNLFTKGISFLTVPIFTRLLTTSDYGVVTTYNSWIAIISMVIGFALHMSIRAAFVDYRDVYDDFVSVTTTFTIESGLVLTAIVCLLSNFTVQNMSVVLIFLCMLQGLSDALIQNYSMYLMMQYRYKFRTVLMVLPNLLAAMISIFVIKFVLKHQLYLGRIIPTALVNVFFGVIIIILVYRKSRALFNYSYLKYGLSISAPLVLHGIALNILSQSDRIMITSLANVSQTGIYSLIYNFGMLATVITTALDGIWVPWFTQKYQNNNREDINNKVLDYVHLITYAMIGLLLVGPEVVKFLAPHKYWAGITIIPPIVLANYIIFIYTLYVNVEHYHKKTLYITINTIIAAISNLILNFIFIPHFGYVAAAYTTLVSYGIALLFHARYSRKLDKELYPIIVFIPSLFRILVSTLIFYVFINLWYIRWCILAVYILVVVIINITKIRALLER